MTRTHFIVALATTAIISAFSAPAQSSIFYPDDRQYVQPTQGSPYSPVGVVYAPGLFVYHFTTGFLVDDCHVLTSQVVAGYGETPLGKRLKFKAAFGTSQHQSSKATVVAGGGFTPGRTSQEQIERGGRDWLLLRLDKCLGASLGHVLLKTGPYSPFEFRDLKSAGYPMSRSNNGGVTIDPSCKVVGGYSTLWMNDCPLARGDGGDPIFRISTSATNPQMIVYAMQSAGFPAGGNPVLLKPGYENRAVPMSLVAPQIEAYLSAASRRNLPSEK